MRLHLRATLVAGAGLAASLGVLHPAEAQDRPPRPPPPVEQPPAEQPPPPTRPPPPVEQPPPATPPPYSQPPPYGQPPARPGYPPYSYPPGHRYPPSQPAYRQPPPKREPAEPPKPVLYDWNPDDPLPDGYRLRSSAHSGLLTAGITLLSVSWTASAVVTSVAAAEEDDRGLDGDGVEAPDWLPLLIPVGGPFATIYTVDARPEGTAFLVIDGVIQAASFAMILGGALAREYRAVPAPSTAFQLQLAPVWTGSLGGLSLTGAF